MKRFLSGLALVALVAGTASAVVPDSELSVTPDCIRVDPSGAIPLDVQVFGTDGNPLGNNDVRVIFDAGCVDLIDETCSQPTVLSGTTDALGMISFAPEIGGCCATGGAVTIEADPGAVTLLPVYNAVGSNDSDGNHISNLGDFVAFQGVFLDTGVSCQDLTCDDDLAVALDDFVIFQSLFLNGSECP